MWSCSRYAKVTTAWGKERRISDPRAFSAASIFPCLREGGADLCFVGRFPMKLILYPLMLLAGCGFVLSVGAHCLALANVAIPGGQLVWGLHIGIFAVWIPTVLLTSRATRNSNRKDFWKVALAGCPTWMRRGLYVLFGYAVLNFVLFIIATAGQHGRSTGDASPTVIRGFSGHWMVFYGVAFAVLYSRIRSPQLYRDRKCPQGHAVAPLARFCPECGSAVFDPVGDS